ncbi:MAG: Hint domain-containing protein [Myxococcota bacterium]
MTPKSQSTRVLIAALAFAPALACGVESSDPDALDSLDSLDSLETQMPTVDELRAESEYMRELFAEQEATGEVHAMPIDLGDDEQYRFMIHRLRSTGVSRLTSPELFERIDHARAVATTELAPRNVAPPVCDMFVTTEDAPEGTLGTIGRASCVDGSDYSLLQICHYDDAGVLLNCTFTEEFVDGIATDVQTQSATPLGLADGVSYHLKATGEEFYFYTTPLLGTSGERSLMMSHPQDLSGDNNVQLCLERSLDSADCDYRHFTSGLCSGNSVCNTSNQPLFPVFNPGEVGAAAGQYNNNRLYMPLQSSSARTYLSPVGATVNSARAWMTLRSSGDSTPAGGLCTADFSDSPYLTFEPFLFFNDKMHIEPFALNLGNAIWPDHCVDHRTAVDLHVEVNLQTGASQLTYAWSSDRDYDSLSVAWGCLPPGTAITMADGTEVSIETIEAGDRVMADDDGGVLTVVDVMVGREDEPLVVIEDSLGHQIPMTITHPVPTLDRGAVEARELVLGDRLETDDGVAYVVGVEREEYEGEVYNLVLGTPEELEARGADTTMVANHVVVGDVRMQGALKVERSAEADEARAQAPLPPELYVDYLGAELRGLVRRLEG